MREQLGPGLGVPGQCQATGAGPMTQWICPGSSVSGVGWEDEEEKEAEGLLAAVEHAFIYGWFMVALQLESEG